MALDLHPSQQETPFDIYNETQCLKEERGLQPDKSNHFNPLDVRANLSDPLNGVFRGNNVRRFRGDFDVL